ACHQFPHCEWLWQIIVRAELQPSNTVLHFAARGQHQDTTGEMLGTQMPKDTKTVYSGQNNIQHDQIERHRLCFIQSSFTVMDHDWIVPGFGERGCNLSR